MKNKTYKMGNILAQCFSNISLLTGIVQVFDKHPELQKLGVSGECRHDDGDMCYSIIDYQVNNRKFTDDDVYEVKENEADQAYSEEIYSACMDMLVIVADGEEMEEIDALITRKEVDQFRPYLIMINAIRDNIVAFNK